MAASSAHSPGMMFIRFCQQIDQLHVSDWRPLFICLAHTCAHVVHRFSQPSTAGSLKPSRTTFPCAAVSVASISIGSVLVLTQHLGGRGVDMKRKAQQGSGKNERWAISAPSEKRPQANEQNQAAKRIQYRGESKVYSSIADTICNWNHTYSTALYTRTIIIRYIQYLTRTTCTSRWSARSRCLMLTLWRSAASGGVLQPTPLCQLPLFAPWPGPAGWGRRAWSTP